jgi:pyruvate formate lyase activating enzyme
MVSPERVVALARQTGCQSIAYTYTEPTIFLEYAMDTAKLASLEGLKNVFVTNGYITPEALRAMRPYLDGANIDLKAFSDEFYRTVCGARLQPVLDSIRLYKELGIWVEVTTLVIPSHNDSEEEIEGATANACEKAREGQTDRDRGGIEVRLSGQRPRGRRREHVLSRLRQTRD